MPSNEQSVGPNQPIAHNHLSIVGQAQRPSRNVCRVTKNRVGATTWQTQRSEKHAAALPTGTKRMPAFINDSTQCQQQSIFVVINGPWRSGSEQQFDTAVTNIGIKPINRQVSRDTGGRVDYVLDHVVNSLQAITSEHLIEMWNHHKANGHRAVIAQRDSCIQEFEDAWTDE